MIVRESNWVCAGSFEFGDLSANPCRGLDQNLNEFLLELDHLVHFDVGLLLIVRVAFESPDDYQSENSEINISPYLKEIMLHRGEFYE